MSLKRSFKLPVRSHASAAAETSSPGHQHGLCARRAAAMQPELSTPATFRVCAHSGFLLVASCELKLVPSECQSSSSALSRDRCSHCPGASWPSAGGTARVQPGAKLTGECPPCAFLESTFTDQINPKRQTAFLPIGDHRNCTAAGSMRPKLGRRPKLV
jgi:hypothetical protein